MNFWKNGNQKIDMKLEKIRFKNINSLRGEHSISFDESPLLDAGLYAITGATGSGKSTILDVITLALYNYVPRLGRISRNSIEKMGSIVTHFTDEAWAEIEYTVNEQRYLSRWSISKTRNNTFRDYDMDIVLLPQGTSVGLKKSEIPAKNQEIIGLTHDQFLKSILLSQGEFSKFLQAKKEERSKLLEDITGTTIYSDLGKLAYEKAKSKKDHVDRLRENINMLQLLSKEEVENYNSELDGINIHLKSLQTKEASLTEIIQLHKEKKRIEVTSSGISSREVLLIKKTEKIADEKILLETHRVAKNYEVHITNIQRYIETRKKLELQKNGQTALYEKSLVQKSSAIAEMSKFVSSDVNELNFYEMMSDFEKKITAIDSQLSELKNQGLTIRSRITKFNTSQDFSINSDLAGKVDTRTAIGLIEARLGKLNVPKNLNINDLQEKLSVLSEKRTVAEKCLVDFIQVEKQASKTQELQKILETQNEHLKKGRQEYEAKLKQETKEEKKLLALEEQLKMLKEKANLDQYRELLEDDKPCPLCGSMHHPYAHEKQLAELGLLTLEHDKQKKELKKISLDAIQLHKHVLNVESSTRTSSQLLIEAKMMNTASLNSVATWREKHRWTNHVPDNKWEDELSSISKKLEELRLLIRQLAESQYLVNVHEEFSLLENITIEFQRLHAERKTLYQGNDVNKDADLIQNKFTTSVSAISSSLRAITDIENENGENEKKIADTIDALEPLQKRYELPNVLDCQNLLLSNSAFNTYNENSLAVSNERAALLALKIDLSEKVDKYTSKKKQLVDVDLALLIDNSEAAVQELYLENNQEIKKGNIQLGEIQNTLHQNDQQKKKVKQLKNELEQLEGKNKIWILLSELIGDSKGKKFSNYAQDLTLVHLLTRANARLESLTDRYLISFRPEEDDLLVIDRYQGDTERTVKTLSGGETFLLSLALALSLSDFASKRVRLESLFIDEGFGTLDQETLDTAMSTLEKLQHASGKRIGIISHVESLKERITTQIRVQKSAQGYSVLEIVS